MRVVDDEKPELAIGPITARAKTARPYPKTEKGTRGKLKALPAGDFALHGHMSTGRGYLRSLRFSGGGVLNSSMSHATIAGPKQSNKPSGKVKTLQNLSIYLIYFRHAPVSCKAGFGTRRYLPFSFFTRMLRYRTNSLV